MPIPAGPGAAVYGDLATLKSMLAITDSTRDTLLTLNLSAASRLIDSACSRRFYADSVVSDRFYTPERREAWYASGGSILTDDISSISGLAVAEGYQGFAGTPAPAWTDVTNDCALQPDNALALGRPITSLRRSIGFLVDPYIQVRVTAKWGWPAVPDEITMATLIQAARLFRRKDSPEGVLGNSEWGALRVSRVDPDVAALIGPYIVAGFA